MVALLEATMWRQIRDPDYPARRAQDLPDDDRPQPDGPRLRQGLVGRAACRSSPPTPPFPTEAALELPARRHRPHALRRELRRRPTTRWSHAALQSVCSIPLASARLRRAPIRPGRGGAARLDSRRLSPARTAPRSSPGARSKTLRVGIAGLYTYEGFHDVVLARLQDVAAQAALDRSVFAGGCPESADASVAALADDMLKLYYDDFVAQWDGFLHDVTLAPLTDLPTRHREPQGSSRAPIPR